MKKILALVFVMSISATGFSQASDTSLPYYKRFPVITPFEILLPDSVTKYKKEDLPKGKPAVFIVFSPDCSHCQHEAEQIVELREKLKDITIVMITMHSLESMKEFITNYKLNQLSNVIIGRDIYYMMPAFYRFHNLPFHALYNKEGKLLSVFEGSINIGNLADLMAE